MADLEATLVDVSYLMIMEKSKCTSAARACRKITKRLAEKPSTERAVELGTTISTKHKSHSHSVKTMDHKKETGNFIAKKFVNVDKIKKKEIFTNDVGRRVTRSAENFNKTIVDLIPKTSTTSDRFNNHKAPLVSKNIRETTEDPNNNNHNKKFNETGRMCIHKLFRIFFAEDTTVAKTSSKESTPEENKGKPKGALKRKSYNVSSNRDASKKKGTAAAVEEQNKIPIELNINN